MAGRAVDTVTNFTSMAPDIEQAGHRHIIIITSQSHVSRASACAAIVLGAHNIRWR
eukprot:COSAG06_NODE_43323_length_373_cov_0.718978_1_plen_55_part_01